MKFAFGGSCCQTRDGREKPRVRAMFMVTHWICWIDSSLILEHSSLGWRTRILNSNWPLTCYMGSKMMTRIVQLGDVYEWDSSQAQNFRVWTELLNIRLLTLVIRYNKDNNIVCRDVLRDALRGKGHSWFHLTPADLWRHNECWLEHSMKLQTTFISSGS